MPKLDRRITVRRTATTLNAFGEPSTTDTDYPVWAGVADLSAYDTESEGGTFNEALRKWEVRFRSEFADAPTDELVVIDGGLEYNVTNIVRQRNRAERRRFMVIEGVAIP